MLKFIYLVVAFLGCGIKLVAWACEFGYLLWRHKRSSRQRQKAGAWISAMFNEREVKDDAGGGGNSAASAVDIL